MKKIICGLLAVLLVCCGLVGCKEENSAAFSSAGSEDLIENERFIALDDGTKAFNFTSEFFKAKFNSEANEEERKIREWAPVEEDNEKFYRYEYGGGAAIYLHADLETDLVKSIVTSMDLIGDSSDGELWGQNVISIMFTIDPEMDSVIANDILEELEMLDLDTWSIGHETNAEKNDIFYMATIDENYTYNLIIIPMPDDDSDTNIESSRQKYDQDGVTFYPISPRNGNITQDQFDQLREGMSYSEVMNILDSPEDPSIPFDDQFFTCEWGMNSNTAFVLISFRNGKLSTMKSYGLE